MSQQEQELSDEEFACLLFRSCRVDVTSGVFGAEITKHAVSCRFCLGILHVA
jgi:hypothetical protein